MQFVTMPINEFVGYWRTNKR